MKKRDDTEERMVRLFGSTSRPRILNLVLCHPHRAFYQREIMYETGLSLQAVQRELENLLGLGILKKRETNARVYYEVDTTSPWFRPLKEICE
jgi:predicted transcriptional regulator